MKTLNELEKQLGVKFKKKELLKQALVHRSYLNEHPNFPLDHNERLEFLGDAVLELIITKFLYKNFDKPEGKLTSLRSSLVNTKSLSKTAKGLRLGQYIYLSKGETRSKGRAREVILANALEALIGAIYLDRGFGSAERFIHQFLLPQLDIILKHQLYRDSKTRFQEITQRKLKITPSYTVIKESGPDHNKKFIIGVYVQKKLISTGRGRSKKEAELSAAKNALKKQNLLKGSKKI